MPNHDKFRIDRDVPYPGRTNRAGRPRKTDEYPLLELEIGESFFVPSSYTNFSAEKTLRRALERARRDEHLNLVWTQEPGGFRIYRIEGEPKIRTYHQRRSSHVPR